MYKEQGRKLLSCMGALYCLVLFLLSVKGTKFCRHECPCVFCLSIRELVIAAVQNLGMYTVSQQSLDQYY